MKKFLALSALALSALLFLGEAHAQEKVSFYGFSLGSPCEAVLSQLKSQSFKKVTEETAEDTFTGPCRKIFLTGEYDACPVALLVKASKLTGEAYEVEFTLRNFIDIEEAVEEANRILSVIHGRSPWAEADREETGTMPEFVEMTSAGKHITKYMVYPQARVLVRLYESKKDREKDNRYGIVSLLVCQNSLEREHLVTLRFYDSASGERAENAWKNKKNNQKTP